MCFSRLCFKFAVCFLKSLKLTRRVKEMCTWVPDNKHIIVLVGGGKTPDIWVYVTLIKNSLWFIFYCLLMYCWLSTCDFQALPPWFVPKRCGRTATRVESSWLPKIICPHLTSPNSARCEICQKEEEWTHLYISLRFMKRLFYFFLGSECGQQ